MTNATQILNEWLVECVLRCTQSTEKLILSSKSMGETETNENPSTRSSTSIEKLCCVPTPGDVEDVLHREWIVSSQSNYSSPVVAVCKKDGSRQLCIDFWQLSQKIQANRHPLRDAVNSLAFLIKRPSKHLSLWRCVEEVLRASWRDLEDVLRITSFCPPGRFQDVFKMCLQDVFLRTSSTRLHEDECVMKTTWKIKNCLQDIFKMYWKTRNDCWGRPTTSCYFPNI